MFYLIARHIGPQRLILPPSSPKGPLGIKYVQNERVKLEAVIPQPWTSPMVKAILFKL